MAYCAYCGSFVTQVSFVPCASCGNPTNGAPQRPRTAGGTNAAAIVIIVVALLFIVVAIIGIFAAIAIPNLLTAMQRSKQKRTMADMRTVVVSLEAYGVDHPNENYPEGTEVSALVPHLVPTYLKALPTMDGWGTGMRYRPLDNRGFAIISAGADKKFEVDSPEEYGQGPTNHFDCDIVYANGAFQRYPEGVQSMAARSNE